ncbi:hypothetical protein JB92DRAFT_2875919, partial [Gautieria morchelliformis]
MDEFSIILRDAPLESSDFSSLGTLNPQVNAPFRALELGAGTGLALLVLGKCTEPVSFDTCRVLLLVDTVFATDFHPSVLSNLRFNFAINFPAAS